MIRSQALARLVFGWLLDTINHQDLDGPPLRFQFESELLLQRRKERWTVRIDRWRHRRTGRKIRRRSTSAGAARVIRRPRELQVEAARETCLVDDRASELIRQEVGQRGQRLARRLD